MGLALGSLQMVLLTGLGPCFHSGELPYQCLGTSLLLGHALGYRIPPRVASAFLLITLGLPLGLLVLRGLSPALSMPYRVLLGSLLAVLSTAALAHQTLFWWRRWRVHPAGLRWLYSLEMLGAASGLGLAMLLGPGGLLLAFPAVVWAAMAPGLSLRGSTATLMAAGLATLGWQPVESWSQARCHPGGQLLARAYSPYQLVEIVDDRGQPQLFLNGLCHHNAHDLQQLNQLLAELPADLLRVPGGKALILGGGGFLSARETARRGMDTVVVELDPKVAELSQHWIAREAAPPYRIVVADARQYTASQEKFDLIVFSLPYPYSLNVAALFTREYFSSLQKNLKPGGLVSIFLGNPVRSGGLDPASAAFLRAVRQAFPKAVGVSSGRCQNTVVLASCDRPLAAGEVYQHLRAAGIGSCRVYQDWELDRLCGSVAASSLYDLSACWHLNMQLWGWR